MAAAQPSLLPLHELITVVDAWRAGPSDTAIAALSASLRRLVEAYGASGVYVRSEAASLPLLSVGAGSLNSPPSAPSENVHQRNITIGGLNGSMTVWVAGPPATVEPVVGAIQLVIESAWSRQEARSQRAQLEALDLAVRGIAGILSVERVLQLIVDRVRDLVSAQYAALGIVGPFGRLEQFITSGVTAEDHARIGTLPRGLGLLGLIIREDRSFLIEDVATDPRRHGFPPNHPEMHAFLGVPVRSKGHSIGNLYLTNRLDGRPFSETDMRLVEMFALHAGISIENARLHDELGRLAIVEERQRISQDLHDSVIQSLYAISLSLEDLPEIIIEDASEGAQRADRAIDGIHATIRDIRNFIMGLQPELLVDADLTSGVQSLAAEFRANTLIDLELRLDPKLPELPHDHAAHVLAITREALSNVARHSGATRATVELMCEDGRLSLIIGDNGRGFETDRPRNATQRGLANLRARAEAIGGSLTLTSETGAGTRLQADIPIGDGIPDDK